MSERELLEAAARAAGYEFSRTKSHPIGEKSYADGKMWNPLRENADAFRLMVDCGLKVFYVGDDAIAVAGGHHRIEDASTDKHAATRRAIVRAAAAMGV